MAKRKSPPKSDQDKILSRRNLIIASIVGITVILTFLIELPQKISATIDIFRATEPLTSTNTPSTSATNPEVCNPSDLEHKSFIIERFALSRENPRDSLSTSFEVFYVFQEFEDGYMLWSSESFLGDEAITVLFSRPGVVESGDWKLYEDLWHDPTPELPATLTPPGPGFVQPIRGFGNVWFGNKDVKSNLGWGIMAEIDVDAVVWRFDVGSENWLILCIKGMYSPEVKNPSDYLGITFALIQSHDEEIGTGFWRRLDQ